MQACFLEVGLSRGHLTEAECRILKDLLPIKRKNRGVGACRRALGRSRGGFTSKVHCLADALGRPLAFHLMGGEAADCKAYEA